MKDHLFFSHAKQLIEDTIRRNASPVRLETNQDGSCSSLASSVSDEQAPRAPTNRNSIGSSMQHVQHQSVQQQSQQFVAQQQQQPQQQQQMNHKLSRSASAHHNHMGGMGGPVGPSGNYLVHSLSTSDASLGEYKYTVNVGPYTVKITGDCFDLVRVSFW